MEKVRQTEHPGTHPCLRQRHTSQSALIGKTSTRFPPHSKPHPTTAGSSRADVKYITDSYGQRNWLQRHPKIQHKILKDCSEFWFEKILWYL